MKVALVGNANVGKSALFNHLTGMSQHVANWPGKTVEVAEGVLRFRSRELTIIDLPGIYSLSTFSIEEMVTSDYLIREKPDVVINVIDSTALERNLFLTLQLIELGVPLVIALNQADTAKKKGLMVNACKISDFLGVPAVQTIATKGAGAQELVELSILVADGNIVRFQPAWADRLKYAEPVEQRIKKLSWLLTGLKLPYPERYAAIKLLENDTEIMGDIKRAEGPGGRCLAAAGMCTRELEQANGEPSSSVISSERYAIAARIAASTQEMVARSGSRLSEQIDELTTHNLLGPIIMALVLGSIFFLIFSFGNTASSAIGNFFSGLKPASASPFENLLWEGVVGGFVAGLTLVLPYVLPFYLLLSLLEDTGYITRVAYLMDGIAHRIGFHGKAIIPLLLGYGCSVPACFSCRIMEYDRDRLITAFAVTLVPCTARTVVILALVATYLGVWWALAIYVFNLIVVALLAKAAFKILPGEPVGLIMEMPPYKLPTLRVVAKQTFMRIKSLLTVVFPYYIGGGLLLGVLHFSGVLGFLNSLLSPVTVGWLGLPAFAGALLVFGIVRKELVVVLPPLLYGTSNLGALFTPPQMIVLTVVTILYIPCLATMEALRREFGLRKMLFITSFELVFAILVGGLLSVALAATGLP
ncbi:ferrous iron transport protein B [Candidatus Micrarchaeota archaeon CG1_02_49_24]|nr:MAG: ferrous iron transport protein B [Candidatus Micrarchaeota archaeon CG1_02_49_24]